MESGMSSDISCTDSIIAPVVVDHNEFVVVVVDILSILLNLKL